jgi:hypothetical protein
MQNQTNFSTGDRVEISEAIRADFPGLLPKAAHKGTVEMIKINSGVPIALVHFDGCAIYKIPADFLVKLESKESNS